MVLLFSMALATVVVAQPRRLRIVNGCDKEPLWIAHEAASGAGPGPQNVRIGPKAKYDFITTNGLMATRYWPKMGCNEHGNNCALGGSGGPGEACVRPNGNYSLCAPPIDTKFEATFGQSGSPCDPSVPGGTQMAGCDYVDVSLVDGFTLPFKLEIDGDCKATSTGVDKPVYVVDCSQLSFDFCPEAEHLEAAGVTTNLKAINPNTGKVSGCYAPCQKLLDTKWNNHLAEGRQAGDPQVAPYCCPTPPESPEACRAGPIKDTQFLAAVHTHCPGVYAYAYDDGNGLMRCSASSKYTLTLYCPAEPPGGNKQKVAADESKQIIEKKEEAFSKEDAKHEATLQGTYCCFASDGGKPGTNEFCHSCVPKGYADPESWCAGGKDNCHNCGGDATWCEGRKAVALQDLSNDNDINDIDITHSLMGRDEMGEHRANGVVPVSDGHVSFGSSATNDPRTQTRQSHWWPWLAAAGAAGLCIAIVAMRTVLPNGRRRQGTALYDGLAEPAHPSAFRNDTAEETRLLNAGGA